MLEITSYELYLLGVQEVADVSVLEHVLRPLHQVQGVVTPQLGLVPDLHPGHVLLDADEHGGVGEGPGGGRGHLVRVPLARNVTEHQAVKMRGQQLSVGVGELCLLEI